MQDTWKSKGKKVHSRKIEISTYRWDEQRIVVEGSLREDRFQDSYLMTGEKFPKGVIHHMAIRLLLNCSNLLIEDVDVELIAVPRDICRETADCLAQIKGLTISKGFTSKIKKIAGGIRGCTHLLELLQTMAPAVVQGYAAYRAQNPESFNHDHKKMMFQFLLNTCHAWREDGPFVEGLKRNWRLNRPEVSGQ